MLSAAQATTDAAPTRINYRAWLWRVIAWDGILPLVMFGLPYLLRWLLPNVNIDAMPLLARLGVMFTSESLRVWFGLSYISSNGCPREFRVRQELALVFGVCLLALFDWLMSIVVLGGDPHMPAEYVGVTCVGLYVLSSGLLIFALFPGREPVPSTQIGNWEIEC